MFYILLCVSVPAWIAVPVQLQLALLIFSSHRTHGHGSEMSVTLSHTHTHTCACLVSSSALLSHRIASGVASLRSGYYFNLLNALVSCSFAAQRADPRPCHVPSSLSFPPCTSFPSLPLSTSFSSRTLCVLTVLSYSHNVKLHVSATLSGYNGCQLSIAVIER